MPPFVSYRADRMDDAGFEDTSAALRQRMRALFTDAPIAYRQKNGGDYSIPAMELRSEAVDPELVGFAAHVRHGL